MTYRIVLTALLLLATMSSASAATSEMELADIDIVREKATLKAGAEMVLSICNSCHNLRYLRYRDLLKLGFTQQEVDNWRGEEAMENRILSRTPDDALHSTYGLVPPDLAIIAKAREGGGRYVYTLLTSFYLNEDGKTDNHLFPGIRMPDVLGWSEIEDEKDREDIRGRLRNVASFLQWAADPNAEKRESIGVYVIIYLIILTLLMWLMKRRTWSNVEGGSVL